MHNPSSLFNSELDPNDPEHAAELKRRVFGANYKVDRKGNPISQDRGSDSFYLSDHKMWKDTFRQHITMIQTYGPRGKGRGKEGEYEGQNREAAQLEFDRIKSLRTDAGLSWPEDLVFSNM